MNRWLAAVALATALSALGVLGTWTTTGCNITVADAGAAEAAAAQTVGSQCSTIGSALCTAEAACGLGGSDCASSYVSGCCTTSTCAEDSESSADAVSACTAALSTATCFDLSSSMLPAECAGLPQIP